jgi:molybdate transport system regulatory protein
MNRRGVVLRWPHTALSRIDAQGSTRNSAMKLSARNNFKGTVVKIVPGSVNSEVVLEIADGAHIVSIITNDAVANLGLKAGMTAYAVIKASNVIIGVD